VLSGTQSAACHHHAGLDGGGREHGRGGRRLTVTSPIAAQSPDAGQRQRIPGAYELVPSAGERPLVHPSVPLRGLNEHTTGLISASLPKKIPFDSLTPNKRDKIVDKITNRSRKGLGYLAAYGSPLPFLVDFAALWPVRAPVCSGLATLHSHTVAPAHFASPYSGYHRTLVHNVVNNRQPVYLTTP
jgi:hypothetical protein